MDFTYLAAAAIGFAPPIALMLWTLQRYTYPTVEKPYFSDPTLFGMFAAGIVVGVVLYVASLLLPGEYIFGGFLLEEAVKLMIINMPRFQRRADTPFYAFGLSAGIASALAFGLVNRTLVGAGFDVVTLIVVITYSMMIAFLQISTGTTIGMGVARGTPWPFFGQAVVVHLAAALLLVPFNAIGTGGDSLIGIFLFAVALIFTATYYWYVHRKLLPAYVREALAKMGGMKPKKARKERRSKV
jgi:hypothetical protein